MHTIAQLLQFPDKTPINEVSGTLTKVYEREIRETKFGAKPKQAAMLQDAAGDRVRLVVWDHDDIAQYEGKEISLCSSSGGKGLIVSSRVWEGKTKVELSVGRAAQFQPIHVSRSQSPSDTSAPAQTAAAQAPKVRGEKVGMAINNAVNSMVQEGIGFDGDEIWKRASIIIQVSQALEDGKLWSDNPSKPSKDEKQESAHRKLDNRADDIGDEEVPF